MQNKRSCQNVQLLHVVAEAGLEPRDLRVMSPTSYQLLHSAMYMSKKLGARDRT